MLKIVKAAAGGAEPSQNFSIALIILAMGLPFFTTTIIEPHARLSIVILGLFLIPIAVPLAISGSINLQRLQRKTQTKLQTPVQTLVNAQGRNILSLAYATFILDCGLLLGYQTAYFSARATSVGLTLDMILLLVAFLLLLGPFDSVKRWAIIIEPIALLYLSPHLGIDIFGIAVWQTVFTTISIVIVTLTISRAQMQTLDIFLASLPEEVFINPDAPVTKSTSEPDKVE